MRRRRTKGQPEAERGKEIWANYGPKGGGSRRPGGGKWGGLGPSAGNEGEKRKRMGWKLGSGEQKKKDRRTMGQYWKSAQS